MYNGFINSERTENRARMVMMLCDGLTQQQCTKELDITMGIFTERLRHAKAMFCLPASTRSYPANRDKIIENIALFRKYQSEIQGVRERFGSKANKFT